jgi:ribose transport system substrate-binding protein
MKFTKILTMVIVMAVTIALVVGCAPAAEVVPEVVEEVVEEVVDEVEPAVTEEVVVEPVNNYAISLGAIQPGPEFYYQHEFDSIEAAATLAGMTVTRLISEYSAEKELANVEDLISQGVDAIIMFSVSGDAAQVAAQVCNAADVPLFTVGGTASEGPGVVACSIKNDFFEMGEMVGAWLAENFEGPAKIADIQGLLGADIAEAISRGFVAGIATRTDMEVVFTTPADWDRAKAIAATEDLLASDLDFNVIFVHNEDMCAGVLSVLEEAGVLNNGVQVVTQNGSDDGFKFIREGKLLATVSNSSSYVAGDAVVKIMQYLDGVEIPAVWDSPVFAIDATNVDDPNQITWDISWATQRVEEYLASK